MIQYIYVLVDPTTDEVRDLGKTMYPKTRYRDHLNEARYGARSYKCNIFNSIKEAKQVTGANDISKACRGIYSQSGGYIWKYLED